MSEEQRAEANKKGGFGQTAIGRSWDGFLQQVDQLVQAGQGIKHLELGSEPGTEGGEHRGALKAREVGRIKEGEYIWEGEATV